MAERQGEEIAAPFEIDLESDPRLVLGWRPVARRLAGGRVPLRDDVFESLKQVPQETLARLASSRGRSYEPTAELEQGEEHFVVPISELPVPGPRRRRGSQADGSDAPEAGTSDGDERSPDGAESDASTTLPEVADLIAIIRQVDDLESIGAGRLAEGSFLFYGIVLPGPTGNVAFIKRIDPVTTLRKGRLGSTGRRNTEDGSVSTGRWGNGAEGPAGVDGRAETGAVVAVEGRRVAQ